MPELPEVETVRRVLEPHLLKKKVTGVQIHNAQVIIPPFARTVCRKCDGAEHCRLCAAGKIFAAAV